MPRSTFRPGCVAQSIFYFAAFLLYQATIGTRNSGDSLDPGVLLLAILLASGLAFVGREILQGDRQAGTLDRDREAQATLDRLKSTLDAVRRGDPQNFFLYLRPFSVTHRLPIPSMEPSSALHPTMFYQEDLLDLEEFLTRSLERLAPVVALGNPGEAVGAGRIYSTEGVWKSDFELLARVARGILVIPAANEGTRWEIEWLLNHNQMPRVVFLMPPGGRGRGSFGDEQASPTLDWELAGKELRNIGIELPEYRSPGLLFTLGEDGRIRSQQKFPFVERAARSAIKALLAERGQGRAPIAAAWSPSFWPGSRSGGGWTGRRKMPTLSYFSIGLVFIIAAMVVNWLREPVEEPSAFDVNSVDAWNGSESFSPVAGGVVVEGWRTMLPVGDQGGTISIPQAWKISRVSPRAFVAQSEDGAVACNVVGFLEPKALPSDLFLLQAAETERNAITQAVQGAAGMDIHPVVSVEMIETTTEQNAVGYLASADILIGSTRRSSIIRVLRSGDQVIRIDCAGSPPALTNHKETILKIARSGSVVPPTSSAVQSLPSAGIDPQVLDPYLARSSELLREGDREGARGAAYEAIDYIMSHAERSEEQIPQLSLENASKLALAYIFASEALEAEGRLEEAIEKLQQGLEIWRMKYGLDDEEVMAQQKRLASLLERSGRSKEADEIRAEIAAFMSAQ